MNQCTGCISGAVIFSVCSACISFPLHLPLAKDEAGVSSGQQGVGVPEVSAVSRFYTQCATAQTRRLYI